MQKENLFFFSFSSESTFGVAKDTQKIALFSLFLTIWYGDNILTQNGE